MTDSPGMVSNSELHVQILGLGAQIADVKKLLVNNEAQIRCLERAGDKTTPLTNKRIDDLESVTDEHEKELKELRSLINTQSKNIDKLTDSFDDMQRIWKWALGVFTTVIIALIILFVTGQAEVIFK